jgi:hypothetical protein
MKGTPTEGKGEGGKERRERAGGRTSGANLFFMRSKEFLSSTEYKEIKASVSGYASGLNLS